MDRLITVTGTGSVSVAPDYIEVYLNISGRKKDYAKAVDAANDKVLRLQEAVKACGLDKEALKTTNFRVDVQYENVRDEKGAYHQQFLGYLCHYDMKLSFAFDTKLLSKVLSEIAQSKAEPELNIQFTVENADAVRRELLQSAAQNAREKAEILCQASGVQLGELVNIDYNWADRNFVSATRYAVSNDAMPLMAKRAAAPEFTPENIQVKDSAAFRWLMV